MASITILPFLYLFLCSTLFNGAAAITSDDAAKKPARSSRGTLQFTYSPNITRVTIDHPPINLFDYNLAADVHDFLISIQPSHGAVKPPKVVVFDSADPDFFIAHIDLTVVIPPITNKTEQFFRYVLDIVQYLRNTTSTVFISEANGRLTGFGNEFFLQNDLRFVGPNARVSQFETSLGAFPGAGGVQALPRLINRGRALQYILTSAAVDNAEGAAIGWFNEYYNDTTTLKQEVDKIAKRIALVPLGGINATKAAIPELYPPQSVYDRDTELFFNVALGPDSQALLKKALVLGKNQTRSQWELDLPDSLLELYE